MKKPLPELKKYHHSDFIIIKESYNPIGKYYVESKFMELYHLDNKEELKYYKVIIDQIITDRYYGDILLVQAQDEGEAEIVKEVLDKLEIKYYWGK